MCPWGVLWWRATEGAVCYSWVSVLQQVQCATAGSACYSRSSVLQLGQLATAGAVCYSRSSSSTAASVSPLRRTGEQMLAPHAEASRVSRGLSLDLRQGPRDQAHLQRERSTSCVLGAPYLDEQRARQVSRHQVSQWAAQLRLIRIHHRCHPCADVSIALQPRRRGSTAGRTFQGATRAALRIPVLLEVLEHSQQRALLCMGRVTGHGFGYGLQNLGCGVDGVWANAWMYCSFRRIPASHREDRDKATDYLWLPACDGLPRAICCGCCIIHHACCKADVTAVPLSATSTWPTHDARAPAEHGEPAPTGAAG
jgi:hypothetical protein